MAELLEHLKPLVGEEHIAVREGVVVVSPKNTSEVAAVLGFADRHGVKVRPVGGRTKLGWGAACEAQIELSLLRLNRVVDHPWQDLTCTVQAGCTWQALEDTLARHGQFVALDALWPEKATVGGVCATNDSGALRHRYGSLRDQVLGMTIVLADGTIAKTGGRVVKNVAGYDLPKLMVGSMGTLAVITEVTFRLYSLPLHSRSFTVAADTAAKLAPLMQAIRDSHLAVQVLQMRGDASGFALDVEINAHPDAGQDAMLAEIVVKNGLSLQPGFWLYAERDKLWEHERLILKATIRPNDLASYAQEIVDKDGSFVAQSIGIVYAAFARDETTVRLAEEFRYHLDLQGGTSTVLKGNSEMDPVVGMSNIGPLMQAIKVQFDANNTLNPLVNQTSSQPAI
ncbi:FAD-binding oxidoreductase [Terriglobus tenax]|uniref:FAD-binding oxidoreductase n=1 Tax=Terriglobus tenax TaxID=1111115 RepID=UPI0021E0276A|nr:FAD-binding oxidoreductase [Terriglobus tenax]